MRLSHLAKTPLILLLTPILAHAEKNAEIAPLLAQPGQIAFSESFSSDRLGDD